MWDKAGFVLVGANDATWSWWDHTGWYWAMGLHGVFWLALIALLIVTAVALIRSSTRASGGTEGEARSALDVRDARGEIDRGEYLERKRDLA
jgi:uncharacterized membrane protein